MEKRNAKKFKFLEHTADIKFKSFGGSFEEVVKNAGLATINSMCDENVESVLSNDIKINGTDKENLLYNFLDEIIFLFDSENFLVSEIKNIRITGEEGNWKLDAELSGDSSEKYEIKQHVKSVTYNEMFVSEDDGQWTAQVVLDV